LEQALLRLKAPRLHWDSSTAAAAERAALGMINASVVHMGYRYDSTAVIEPCSQLPSTEDNELMLDGAPGSRLPHAWVEQDGRRVSTLDLVHSRFTLFTGSQDWVGAAKEVADRLRLSLEAVAIDTSSDWSHKVGLAEKGAVLVRPDQFVAWRSQTLAADPADDLVRVLEQVLARTFSRGRQH
jgi:hypothetical protein